MRHHSPFIPFAPYPLDGGAGITFALRGVRFDGVTTFGADRAQVVTPCP
ncbi:MAG TPA: hypothetical protein VMT11_13880 [Myxococcaceae bacterium]|nr:hypothetical protein [Myxococcaceae bacterium]